MKPCYHALKGPRAGNQIGNRASGNSSSALALVCSETSCSDLSRLARLAMVTCIYVLSMMVMGETLPETMTSKTMALPCRRLNFRPQLLSADRITLTGSGSETSLQRSPHDDLDFGLMWSST